MIKSSHFRESLDRTLSLLAIHDPRLHSPASVQLMLGTAAQESHLGYYLRQHPTGPARGPYQIEQATHMDVIRYIKRPSNVILLDVVTRLTRRGAEIGEENELVDNLAYSHAIARIRYWYEPDPLPEADDILGLGEYWDTHYNANPDHGTPEEFVANYEKFVE